MMVGPTTIELLLETVEIEAAPSHKNDPYDARGAMAEGTEYLG